MERDTHVDLSFASLFLPVLFIGIYICLLELQCDLFTRGHGDHSRLTEEEEEERSLIVDLKRHTQLAVA